MVCLLQVLNLGAEQFDVQAQASRGEKRVFQVMYQGFGGLQHVHRKIACAETKNLVSDLNIVELSKQFGCKTKMGQAYIAFVLERVVSTKDHTDAIAQRQKMIAMFVENPVLLVKFETLIAQAVQYEAAIMKFMEGRVILDPQGNPFRFIDVLQKRNPYLMGWSVGSSALNLATAPFTHVKNKIYQVWGSYENIYDKSVTSVASKFTWSNLQNLPSALQNLSGKAIYENAAAATGMTVALTLALWNHGYATQDLFWALYSTSVAAEGLYNHYSQAVAIRDALYAFNRMIYISQELDTICQECGVCNQFAINSMQSSYGRNLLQELQHERYEDNESLCFATPIVHSLMYDIYEYDMYLAPLYASIAEIDAYVAIARTMVAMQNTAHPICFAQLIDAEKPVIQARDFWNLLVSPDRVVTNNLFEDRNIILTGANEGGKTTAIRAILQNIVLAQTFGIAAAAEFKLTQFDVLHSFLSTGDDILAGKSRFGLELKQAQDILHRIKILKPNEKYFFVLDELFTGTNGQDGAQCAYRFIDNIASFENIQFIYATHFDTLKEIGVANSACINYKIEPPLQDEFGNFMQDDRGQFIYPYKMSLGVNSVNVAIVKAQQAGIFAA